MRIPIPGTTVLIMGLVSHCCAQTAVLCGRRAYKQTATQSAKSEKQRFTHGYCTSTKDIRNVYGLQCRCLMTSKSASMHMAGVFGVYHYVRRMAWYSSYKGTFPLMRSGRRWAERIFGFQCFHVVCFHYGGAVAVRRRASAADPQNGSWSHFSVPPCGAVAVWRQLASTLLKYRSRYIDIKNNSIARWFDRRISCCAAVPSVKFQSDWRALSINLRALGVHGMLG